MEKSEGGDFPANKVKSEPVVNFPANFPVFGRSPATSVMSVPEQNQQVVMTSGPKYVPVKLTPVKRSQLQSPPHLKQTAAPQPLTHPSIQPLKLESPRACPRQTPSEVKDVTPKRQKQCSCKNSLCLKLYCECFASGIYCDGCKCSNCHNNVENEPARHKAVEATLERKPHAFRPKIASSPHGARDNEEETGDGLVLAKHNRGCHCKKSGCLKKYCECFQANILCSENCKCMDCKNFEGSEERQALFRGDHANNTAYLQQGANAAITGAIGSSGYGSPPFNKKRNGQELFFGSTIKDPIHRNGQLQEEADVESCEQSSSISLKRAKRKTFVAWDSFVRLKPDISSEGEFKVQCTICKEDFIMTPTFETANLKHHLENKNSLNKAKEGQNEPIDQKTYREKMSLAICRHHYAFSFVEHKGIRDIHSYLNPIAKHISRNTAKSDILNLYAREKELLKAELALISSRVCLTSDIWTSLASNGYMCVTAHYVDLNWVLQKRVLIFRHIPPPHSGAVLGHLLIDFLKEWGIEKKIFTLTLDNATSNNGVVDNLKNHLSLMRSLVCEGKFLHVCCGNHILNLIVKAGLEIADVAIGKIREGVKYIKNSEARLERFAECISNLGLPCSKKLRQDMPIRWNSTYQMIESAVLYQQAYIHYDLVDPDFTHGLFEDEWKRVKIVATFLKPFYDISTLFSGGKYPTANLYLPNVCKIKMLLEEHKNSEDSVMREMAIPMLRKFKKYWQSYSVILSIAMVLDPRYKLNFVKFFFSKLNSDTADKKVKVIKKNLQLLFKEYLIPSTMASVTASLPKEHACGSSNDMTVAFEEFDVFESQLESSTAKTQLDLYLEEANLDRKTNPNLDVLGFWKDNRLRYPELSLMARDILSVPITTVASKSAFSTGGRVIGKFQTSVLPANAEAEVCTRDWICGQEDFDGFESDSDEDEIAVDLQPYLEKHRGHCTSNTQSTIAEATESLSELFSVSGGK